jgi:imidazolonepropionase-like amidohydrolase
VDVSEVGDVNPHIQAWVAVHPHSELIPVARANGITVALAAPGGGLISGQSALIRLAGTTPDALKVKSPAAMHMNYPTGRPPFDFARIFDEPELKTFEERQRDKKKNQEKDLNRLRNLLEEAKAYGAALDAAKSGAPLPRPDLPMEALAPVARGAVPVIMRADTEDDIRGALKFAEERKLKLIIAGGLEAWRCADLLKQKGVPVLVNVDRLPRKESDPYDAAYANPAALQRAGVAFAIVSDDASQSRNLPYEAAMARAFGLPAEAALRAITLSPAEIFGLSDRMGSLEPGKDANIFVASGDIMDHRVQVTHVFIDGVEQSLETRHTRLYKQFKDRN